MPYDYLYLYFDLRFELFVILIFSLVKVILYSFILSSFLLLFHKMNIFTSLSHLDFYLFYLKIPYFIIFRSNLFIYLFSYIYFCLFTFFIFNFSYLSFFIFSSYLFFSMMKSIYHFSAFFFSFI